MQGPPASVQQVTFGPSQESCCWVQQEVPAPHPPPMPLQVTHLLLSHSVPAQQSVCSVQVAPELPHDGLVAQIPVVLQNALQHAAPLKQLAPLAVQVAL